MNRLRAQASGLAALSLLALFGLSQQSFAGPMATGDTHTMKSCMAMSDDDMMKDQSCMSFMKKMDLSAADMKTAKSCMAMSNDAMMKDMTCTEMMKKHPEMFAHKGGPM